MTYKSAEKYTPLEQAGIYQRLALAMHAPENGANKTRLDGEDALRKSLIEEIRESLGFSLTDMGETVIHAIIKALYKAADFILGREDESEIDKYRGAYLSDNLVVLMPYQQSLQSTGSRLRWELHQIEKTIQYPDDTASAFVKQGFMSTKKAVVYARAYPNSTIPYTLLVLAEVEGRTVKIKRAVRYYPSDSSKVAVDHGVLVKMVHTKGLDLTAEVMVEELLAFDEGATIIAIYDDAWVYEIYQGGDLGEKNDLSKILPIVDLGSFIGIEY